MLKWSTSRTNSIDPTIDFRIGSAGQFYAEDFLKTAWWMTVVEIRGMSIDQLVDRAAERGHSLRVPFFYDGAARKSEAEVQHVSIYAQSGFIRAANVRDNDLGVHALTVASAVPAGHLAGGKPKPPGKPVKVPDGTVVIAVIDSGIALAHELFRRPDNTTRVHCAWIMDAQPSDSGIQGRRFEKPEIDALLAANTRSGLLDEDAFYRRIGLIDFARSGVQTAAHRLSHGTHVMGLAAGVPPSEDERKRPIICVQLPDYVVMDVTGERLADTMNFVLEYVFDCVRRFEIEGQPGVRPPLVLNFSFGNFAGPHDGTGRIARRLDLALAPAATVIRRRMTLPAGNGNLSRCHAEIRFENGYSQATLDWRVQPDDRSESFVQLWMPWRPAGEDENLVRVTLEPPGGPETAPVGQSFGDQVEIKNDGGETIAQLTFVRSDPETDRGVIDIGILPTASLDAGTALAPSGLWKIRVTQETIEPHEPVQVWIRRDETLPGFPRLGRQSRFDNACYERFDERGAPLPVDPAGDGCILRRAGTLSGFACGRYPAVIAGFVETTGDLADYSAAGPITSPQDQTTPNRTGPDAAARSDDSPVADGVLSAGSRSGTLVAMNGTSVSTPQVAFWVAGELEAGRPGDRQSVWNKGVTDDPNPPPEDRAGGGRMRLPRRLGPRRP